MPAPETLGLFALAALALVAVPGPNLLYIANRALADGRRAGLASVLGVETGTLVWACAAAAGLSALLASSALAFDAVRYVLPQFVVEGHGPAATQILVLGLVLACVGVTVSSLWALAAGSLGERVRGSAVARRRQRRFTGGVYLALGAFAAVFSAGRTS